MERYNMHGTPQYIYHNQWNSNPSRGYRNPHGNQRLGYETPKYNEDYWCETCDRGFPSQNVLESHKQQHQKCNIDGCQFTAHPKMITKHIQMQHSTGLFKKISNINNPEDIKKWVDERKRKYPTKINVEKKALEMKEKIERGEKMGLKNYKRNEFKYDGNYKRKNINNNNHQQRNKKFKPNSKVDNVAAKKKAEKPEISFVANDGKKLKPFSGISDLCLHKSILIETDIDDGTNEDQGQKSSFIDDDDDIQTSLVDSPNSKPTICNALSSLIGNYGSSDEDEDLKTNKKSSSNIEINSYLETVVNSYINDTKSTTPDTFHENQSSTIKDDDMCNDSGPEEAKVVKEILSEDTTSTSDTVVNKIENNKRKGKPDNINHMKITRRSTRKKLPSTLLEKLLQNEIRQERNIILQCIKYIRKNDYFDIKNGSTK